METKSRLIAKIIPMVSGSIALCFIISFAFILAQSRDLALREIQEQAAILIQLVEGKLYTAYDQEDQEGWNASIYDEVLTLIHSSKDIKEMNVYKITTGKVAATSDLSLKHKAVDPEDIAAVKEDRTVVLFEKEDGKTIMDITAPLHNKRSQDYAIGLKIDITSDIADINATMLKSILMGLFFILVITLAIFIFTRRIVKPIILAARGFEDLAVGDADLTKRLSVGRQDEIGKLAVDFNTFAEKLQDSIRGIKGSQQEIATLARELEDTSAETAKAVTSLTSSIGKVRESAAAQSGSANNSAATVEEIARNIESLDRSIGEQAACVAEASASIEEMVANISAVTGSVGKMASQFEEVSRAAIEGKAEQEASSILIKKIYERSSSLQDANATISSIASQTNLLAMNAAIEAAHAGNAGRGFSVVADEIRKLAENSAVQSLTIRADIEAVDTAISEVVASSDRLAESFNRVEDRIRLTSELVHQVDGAMNEQQEGSNQLLSALESLKTITIQVRSGSSEMNEGNASLVADVAWLKTLAAGIEKELEGVRATAEQLDSSAKNSAKMAGDAGHAIRTMETAVGRFKI